MKKRTRKQNQAASKRATRFARLINKYAPKYGFVKAH